MAKLKTAIAALGLASILSAAPAKANMFDTVPDYSYINNNPAYVETHQQETPSQAYAGVLEPSTEETQESIESPFTPRVDMLQMPDMQIPAREITVEDYLNENNIDFNSQFTTSWWEYPINLAGSYALNLVWHEFGHYLVANMLGAEDVEMHFFDERCGRSLGCVSYLALVCKDRLCRDVEWKVSPLQRTAIASAGVGFTTMGNVALTSLLKNDVLPDWMRSFTATTSLMMMADRHAYLWISAIKHWAGIDNPGSDFENIINTNFSSPAARDAAYGVLAVASAVELALRWEEVWYLVNTIIGKETEVPEGLGIMPGLYPYGSTLMLGASGEF